MDYALPSVPREREADLGSGVVRRTNGQKVGQWSIPAKAPFHTPGDCVVHRNANMKNTLKTFKFSAPANVGEIAIKALVKYGLSNPVNDGPFF